MENKPKGDWSVNEAADYTKYCLLGAPAIGSKKWCEKLDSKPKGDWTAGEAADYAQHCLIK